MLRRSELASRKLTTLGRYSIKQASLKPVSLLLPRAAAEQSTETAGSPDRVGLIDRFIFAHGRAGCHQSPEIIGTDGDTKRRERAIVFAL